MIFTRVLGQSELKCTQGRLFILWILHLLVGVWYKHSFIPCWLRWWDPHQPLSLIHLPHWLSLCGFSASFWYDLDLGLWCGLCCEGHSLSGSLCEPCYHPAASLWQTRPSRDTCCNPPPKFFSGSPARSCSRIILIQASCHWFSWICLAWSDLIFINSVESTVQSSILSRMWWIRTQVQSILFKMQTNQHITLNIPAC